MEAAPAAAAQSSAEGAAASATAPGSSPTDSMGSLPPAILGARAAADGKMRVTIDEFLEGITSALPEELRDEVLSDDALYYCEADQDVDQVARNMSELKVRRLPVVGDNKRLVGVVSIGDMAQHLNKETVGEILKGVTSERPRGH